MPVQLKSDPIPQMELNGLALKPKGATHFIAQPSDEVQLHFENKSGKLFLGDSLKWLASLESGAVDLVFADPPYNIKKADWDDFESHDEYVDWSKQWLREASRVLKINGTLFVCNFSEILADVKVAAMPFFKGCRWIVWHYKNKANLGSDWGRSHESIVHFRKSKNFQLNIDDIRISYGAHTLKYPAHPQAETSQYGKNGNSKEREHWLPHPKGAKPKDVMDIPTTCNGMNEKTLHPTQKPEELLRRLVLAASNPGDLVIDPFSGSGTTAVVCEQLNRRWMACDCNVQYNEWAMGRLNAVPKKPIESWIRFDRETAERRESIR
jgi:site-specific DNA-methyltransferase (adenine-specific)